MKSREEKAKEIQLLKEKFQQAKGIIVTHYKGLNVEEMTALRRSLREAALEYRVVKNTLARIAAQQTPVEVISKEFVGPVGLAFGYDDPVVLAKKVLEYSKENEKLIIKAGVIEGKYVDPEGLKSVSKLPSRDVQLAMLAGAFAAPLTKMAMLLQATVNRLGYALYALKEKKESEEKK